MDVRCEKCQTEYELDEARLKPGGVTVKCTNCGHMFRIRKRTITNVGTPPAVRDNTVTRKRPVSSKPASPPASVGTLGGPTGPGPQVAPEAPSPGARASHDSILDDAQLGSDDAPTTVDRQWL